MQKLIYLIVPLIFLGCKNEKPELAELEKQANRVEQALAEIRCEKHGHEWKFHEMNGMDDIWLCDAAYAYITDIGSDPNIPFYYSKIKTVEVDATYVFKCCRCGKTKRVYDVEKLTDDERLMVRNKTGIWPKKKL